MENKLKFIIPVGEPLALRRDLVEYLAELDGASYKEILALGQSDMYASETASSRIDGVGHMQIIGPITRYEGPCAKIFGGGGAVLQAAIDALTLLAEDDSIKSIVMEIDSPGGQASGIADFADMVNTVSKTKPVVAFVSDYGASAAYWIASAASKLIVSQTGSVGSIGVYAAITDNSAAKERSGSREITFVSSQSPKKRPDYNTDEGRAQVQVQIDALADVFIGAVARYRNTTVDNVLENFGQGDVVFGHDAVNRGMADKIGTLDDAFMMADELSKNSGALQIVGNGVSCSMFNKLYTDVSDNKFRSPETRSENTDTLHEISTSQAAVETRHNNNGGKTQMTVEEILAQYPEAAAELMARAAQEERNRIMSIEQLQTAANMAVAGDAINKAKFTSGMTASDVALVILQEQDNALTAAQANLAEDANCIPAMSTETVEVPDYKKQAALIAKGGK